MITAPDFLRDAARAERVADVLRAVAHPVRVRIVALLCEGEAHVAEIAARLGAPQAAVSQQLRILRMNGLVTAARSRSFARYRLEEPALRDLTRCVERCDSTPRDRTHAEPAGS